LDFLSLLAVAKEIGPRIKGAEFRTATRTGGESFHLGFSGEGGHLHLTVELEPVSPLLFLRSGRPPEGNGHPLIQQLKTYLHRRRVARTGLLDGERAFEIAFEGDRALIMEPVERTPNLVLIEGSERRIVACYAMKPKLEDYQRALIPGEKYRTLPPSGRIKVSELVEGRPVAAPLGEGELSAKRLHQLVIGLDWWLARELAERAESRPGSAWEAVVETLTRMYEDITSGNCSPALHVPHRERGRLPESQELPFAFPFPLTGVPGLRSEPRETMNDAVRDAFEMKAAVLELERRARRLGKGLQISKRRLERALAALDREEAEAGSEADYSVRGDLILANLSSIRKGMRELKVDSFQGPGSEMTIELDPALSPAENADEYYRKARRAKRKLRAIPERRQELKRRLVELAGAMERVRKAATLDEMEKVSEKFGIAPALPARGRAAETGPTAKPADRLRRFLTSDGWTILVGRSDRANDYLTHTVAQPHDIWFHASALSGSHVILRRPHRTASPSKRAITEAAAVAAYFSKGRKANRVPVVYTEKRFVRKFRKSKPGAAACSREKLVMVKPALPAESG